MYDQSGLNELSDEPELVMSGFRLWRFLAVAVFRVFFFSLFLIDQLMIKTVVV